MIVLALAAFLAVLAVLATRRHAAKNAWPEVDVARHPNGCELGWAREIVDAHGTGRVLSFDDVVCFTRHADRSVTRIELTGAGSAQVTTYPASCELAFTMTRAGTQPPDPVLARELAVRWGLLEG